MVLYNGESSLRAETTDSSRGSNPSVIDGDTILLVEGRKPAAERLTPIIEEQGFSVITAHTRREAWSKVENESPSAILLDTPSMRFSGDRFCTSLREAGLGVPVLLLLPDGADINGTSNVRASLRYPFSVKKLIGRLNRLLPGPDDEILVLGDVHFYVSQRTVIYGGRETHLTPRQASLLEAFMRNPGELLTRAYLMKQVWDTEYLGDTRTLDVHIHWLRKAIEKDPKLPTHIRTVRRCGYRFQIPGDQ
jgi:DNA-binding response OmpR family regulator